MNIESVSFSDKPHPWIGRYVIIRTYASGVHVGYLEDYCFKTCHIFLKNSRRIWYWEGAFTLHKVSEDGVKEAKLSIVKDEFMCAQVEEIIPVSSKAKEQLENMKAHNPEEELYD